MKKVVHVINSLTVGGAETLVKDYAIHLDKEKFEVTIIITGPSLNTIIEETLKLAGIRIIFMGDIIQDNATSFLFKTLNRIKRYHVFRKLIKNEKPDIIHSHLGINSYLCFINTRKHNIKLFHTIHSEISVDFDTPGHNMYFKTTKYCVDKKDMTLITLHQRMNEEAKKIFGTSQTAVINNPIDTIHFSNPTKPKHQIRQELGLPDNALVVGHIGRFSDPKNHSFLLDLFSSLIKKEKKAVLLLIGSGELEDEIKAKVDLLGIEKQVIFLGNRNDIPDLLSIMDRFVFPSKYEGLGLVLLEAQTAGIPCIVSDEVPKETQLSNYITYLSLDDPANRWVDEILMERSNKVLNDHIKNYDIQFVMKQVENLYLAGI